MRKLILIAALSLIATQTYAGGSRSLSLAGTSAHEPTTEPATTQPAAAPQAMPAATLQTPSTTTQPTVTATTTSTTAPVAAPPAPQVAPAAAATTEPTKTTVASKPKHREPSTEARVIRELHRHGIYW